MYNFNDFREYKMFEQIYNNFMLDLDNSLNESIQDSLYEGFIGDMASQMRKDAINDLEQNNATFKAAMKVKRTAVVSTTGNAYKKFYLAHELTPIMMRLRKDKAKNKGAESSSDYDDEQRAEEMAQKKVEAIAKKMEAAKMKMKDEANGDKEIEKLISKIEIEAKSAAADKIYSIASEEQAKAEGWSKERVDGINKSLDDIDKEYAELEKRTVESDKEKENMAKQINKSEEYNKCREEAQKFTDKLNNFNKNVTEIESELVKDGYVEDKNQEESVKETLGKVCNYYKAMANYYNTAIENILNGKDENENNQMPTIDNVKTDIKSIVKTGYKKQVTADTKQDTTQNANN